MNKCEFCIESKPDETGKMVCEAAHWNKKDECKKALNNMMKIMKGEEKDEK